MVNRYLNLEYNTKARWLSYWYQIREAASRKPRNLLVIGKGNGIVEHTIASLCPEIKIVTLDINPELFPDSVGDVRHMPFKDSSFDCILCCQVIEHIPFPDLEKVLNELHRVARDKVILSVPHARKYLKIEIDASLIGTKRLILKHPFNKKRMHSKNHFWEINRGITYRKFTQALKSRFVIERTFLNEVGCSMRFFILNKRISRPS